MSKILWRSLINSEGYVDGATRLIVARAHIRSLNILRCKELHRLIRTGIEVSVILSNIHEPTFLIANASIETDF